MKDEDFKLLGGFIYDRRMDGRTDICECQNSIKFNMLGVFWNPKDEQISKLSLELHLEQNLKEILWVLHC